MLPNHPQRLHRRQNSTPSAFAGVKKPSAPAAARPSRAAGHRRGLSLDTRQPRMGAAQPTARQGQMVSICTNDTGLGNPSQHHLLRETQQQRTPARPGSEHQRHHQAYFSPQASSDIENYLTPHGTPQTQPFDLASFDPSQPSLADYGSQINLSPAHFASVIHENSDFDLFVHDSAQSTPNFPSFHESPASQGYISEGDTTSTRKTLRRVSNGIRDRVDKFENFVTDHLERPITPPDGINFPPTPMETPQDTASKQAQMEDEAFARFNGWDTATLRPNRNQPTQALNMFQEFRRQSEQQEALAPSPANSTTLSTDRGFAGPQNAMSAYMAHMNMTAFGDEGIKMDRSFGSQSGESDNFNLMSNMSQHASPETSEIATFMTAFQPKSDDSSMHTMRAMRAGTSQAPATPSQQGTHRRKESMISATSESVASIADLNIEETKTDTGITGDHIAQYISGPDAADGKWMCIFPDCGKKFGRKENIKSHVQTHLNDRQYQCPTCKKCFVRQHDLKRHAKIHTGNKPYDCQCGNSFARHDALTRHRQRGMCIGAFDGVVRKPVKRGRPRKHRPEMDERMEKSERTRRKNLSISSMSSVSGYSDSSAAPSPADNYDLMGNVYQTGLNSQMHGMSAVSSAPMPTIGGSAPLEPGFSPMADSPHSYISPEAIMERIPSHPASPAKSHSYTPELSQSSSPAPNRYYQMDHNTSGGPDELAGMTAACAAMNAASLTSTAMADTMPVGLADQDDLLLQFTNHSGDPLMTKFDDNYNVDMYDNTEDYFR